MFLNLTQPKSTQAGLTTPLGSSNIFPMTPMSMARPPLPQPKPEIWLAIRLYPMAAEDPCEPFDSELLDAANAFAAQYIPPA